MYDQTVFIDVNFVFCIDDFEDVIKYFCSCFMIGLCLMDLKVLTSECFVVKL